MIKFKPYRKGLRVVLLLLMLSNTVKIKENQKHRNITFEKEIDFDELSMVKKRKAIYDEILKHNIKHPDIVFAQAMLESGNFNSYIFRTNNNLFGMKYPERRETTAKGVNKGYAEYEKWEDSIKDYSLYQQAILKNGDISEDAYLDFLSRRYAEHPEYIRLLRKIIRKNRV